MNEKTVFISYSHDTPEHSQRVLQLANALLDQGVDIELDQYNVRPTLGWPRWCAEQLRPEKSAFVLVICTDTYRQRVEGRTPADEGRGVFWEGGIISSYLYNDKGNKRFIPVLLPGATEKDIPDPLRGDTRYQPKAFDLNDAGYLALYRELTSQPAVTRGPPGPVVPLPPDALPPRQVLTTFIRADISRIIKYTATSVCTTTKRSNPQFERMIRLLMEQTVSDFEYIIVDGYYHTRRDHVARLIDYLNPPFRVRHIPPKPGRWEHIRPALCNALNTSLIWAQGELIVELDDCCIWMSPDWIEKHVAWSVRGFAVSGSWTINGWGDERRESYAQATRIGPEQFYSAHRSYPLQKAIEVNGYEELLDGEQGQSDIVLALMLSQVNVRFMYDPALRVDFDARSHTLTQLSPDPRKSRWGKEAWAVEPKKKMMSDGTPHYANEWLANEIRAEGRKRPSGNHFALDKLRLVPSFLDFDVDAVQQKLEQYVDTNPHDWRDNEEIAQIRGGEFVHSRGGDVAIAQTRVRFAAISPDAKQIVVTSRGSLEKFTRAARKRESIAPDVEASAVYLSPLTGTVLLSSRITKVYSADLTEFEELGESEDVVQALCVSGSERYVAAGGWDCAAHVWNFGTRKLTCSFKKLQGSVTALAFLGDEERLVAGTANGDTYLWDLGSCQELTWQKRFECPISAMYPFTLDNKTWVLVGSQDGSLAICDPSSPESHRLLPQDSQTLQCIHVTSNGAYAVSSGSSGEIRVWDIKRRLLLQTIFLRDPVMAVNMSLELEKIFAITSIGKLLCWSINPRVAQGRFD